VAVELADVERAAVRIAPFVDHTPVLRSRVLDAWLGAECFVKAEHLQRGGAFKFRGATNAVLSLSDEDARRGVAAHSSGNHAAALARAARARGIPAYVVMPKATTARKRTAVERLGAEITWCDDSLDARREALQGVLTRTGAVEIHPFDDERVIAGAGTAALELVAAVARLDVIVVPVGGGGLCSGTSIAAPGCRIIGAAPVDRRATVADGLRTGCSERTSAILRAHDVEFVTVAESEIEDARCSVWELARLMVEPSAAIAFGATRDAGLAGARVGIISSGGNVAPREPRVRRLSL